MPDGQFERERDEHMNAPACGCCLLVVHKLRVQAAVLYEEHAHDVYPTEPGDAVAAMSKTRWADILPSDAFSKFVYGDVSDALNPDTLTTAAGYLKKRHLAQWDRLTTDRNEAIAAASEQPERTDET